VLEDSFPGRGHVFIVARPVVLLDEQGPLHYCRGSERRDQRVNDFTGLRDSPTPLRPRPPLLLPRPGRFDRHKESCGSSKKTC